MAGPFHGLGRHHQVDDQWRRLPSAARGRVVGVTGATGAPGRTFIAVNLAAGLAASGVRTCLVDADPSLGAVAVQLDLGEEQSLPFLAHEATLRAVDDDLLRRHLQQAGPLAVLAGQASPTQLPVPGQTLGLVLDRLRDRYQVVVVDVGSLTSAAALSTALQCQLLVLVVVATRLGADLFDRTLSSSLAAPLRAKPSLVILNHLGGNGLAEPDAGLRRRYGLAVGAAIPHRRDACLAAEAIAKPAVLEGPLRRPLARCATMVGQAVLTPKLPGPSDSAVPRVALGQPRQLPVRR